MNKDQKELLLEAASALQECSYSLYEWYTENSTTDHTNWSFERKCRYGSEYNYELSLKLIALANEG